MSKNTKNGHLPAFIGAQIKALRTGKAIDRLGYIVAGVKDGRFYSMSGTDFGEATDIEDCEFITEKDMAMSRLSDSKLNQIQILVDSAFGEDEEIINLEDEDTSTEDEAAPTEDEAAPTEDEAAPTEDDELFTKAMKAIKNKKFKKANKIVAQMSNVKLIKKITKLIKV